MAVHFRKPENKRDWGKFAQTLIFDGLPDAVELATAGTWTVLGGYKNALGIVKAVRGAVGDSSPEQSIDERAWVWLRVSLTAATFALLNEPDLRSPLDTPEKKAAAKSFLADALTLDAADTLDLATLLNPTASPAVATVVARLPELVRQLAPETTLPDDAIRARFARILRQTSSRIYALDTDYYRPVADAVTGPFSVGERRDLAWARHEDWIRGLYHRDPIFSPDADETIPLSAVYHRLRCFWYTLNVPARAPGEPISLKKHKPVAHIADLHGTLHAWLRAPGKTDTIRVVAGGPGSGKSSFSRAFAAEVIAAADHRVIHLSLQHLQLGGDLRTRIGEFLRGRWHATDPDGGGGFEENPLDWRSWETLPYLVIFDGLDELSHADDTARDLSRKFIQSVRMTLASLNTAGPPVRALILGRSAAVQDGLKEADLDRETLVHMAPLTPLIAVGKPAEVLGDIEATKDPEALADRDERPAFWRRSAAARGWATEPSPEAVAADALRDLSAEPLLLHLLIVSGYTGANWQQAADNRNLVYRAIFTRIFARNKAKDHPATRNLAEADFFTLLECLGLAAWRGNGRTGSAEDFAALRDLHATGAQRKRFGTLAAADLRSVAIQIHTRRDADAEGFEFIHKSFGEYLAARGLLSAGQRAARLTTEGAEPWSEAATAEHWVKLIAQAELSEEILRFLVDEARLLAPNHAEAALAPLTHLFNWSLAHGMPVHSVTPDASYRDLETKQRCAESALLAVLDALNRRVRSARLPNATEERTPAIVRSKWGSGR